MNNTTYQPKSKGQTTVSIMVIISALGVWCSGLSLGLYSVNGTSSGLTASVGDLKETIDKADLPSMKAEVDFLAKQRGYKPPVITVASATTTDQ